MKSYTNMGDPEKKRKPKPGKAQKGPITNETLKEDYERAKDTPNQIPGKEGKTMEGAPAPRVGGKHESSGKTPQGSPTVRLMKESKKRAKKSAASPAAKKAAIRALRNMY